jgi:hypothetical protein
MGTAKIRKVTIVTDIEIEIGIGVERHVQVDHHEMDGTHVYIRPPYIGILLGRSTTFSLAA